MSEQHTSRPTKAGIAVLQSIAAGRHPASHLTGRSAMGGYTATFAALRRAGLIVQRSVAGAGWSTELSDAGRAAIAKATGGAA